MISGSLVVGIRCVDDSNGSVGSTIWVSKSLVVMVIVTVVGVVWVVGLI